MGCRPTVMTSRTDSQFTYFIGRQDFMSVTFHGLLAQFQFGSIFDVLGTKTSKSCRDIRG